MMGGGSFGVFGGFLSLVLLAVLVVAGVVAVRWLMEDGKATPRGREALEILRERLARGEIDPEEYEARRKVLEQS
ncbi:hypothetical protein C2I36_10490 [Rhodobacteraceae bacterium WD3A24]|nr:hypothetical protein C2I36_10490 [Rhodobacteraceae bacterium WD3A24]